MPEPDEAKVSSPVLRGVGSRKAPLLPGLQKGMIMNPIYLFISVLLAFTLITAINGAYIKLSAFLLRYHGIS